MKLVAGNSNRPLAEAIAAYLKTPLARCIVRRFADDEIFVEEARPYRMPWAFGVNRNVIIPPMLAHASEDVKKRFIPAMLRGDHIWCQLLSEPSGGSDLAGLTCKAIKDGDTVTATCKVGGAMDNLMMLIECS